LATTGVLLLETSVRQAPLLVEAVAETGLIARVVHDEELSATVVIATRLPPPPSSGVR
jgi:release factor glutamine methyltransferase